jgi:hypothetical protein
MLRIRENYEDYEPPVWVARTVERLLSSLSAGHVSGLSGVVLTESTKIGKGKSRRVEGRKSARNRCLGMYQHKRHGEPAAIFLVVDNILDDDPHLHWLQFWRDSILGDVLFHEIGHHLHATVGSAASGGEASANEWRRRLWRIHLWRKYWYLRPIVKPVRWLAGLLLTWLKRWRAG